MTRSSFGTSTPTVFFPGIGATTRTAGTRSAIARSSARLVTFESRNPASSSSSNCVITGPVSTSTTFTLRPNSPNVFSSVTAATRAFFARSSYGNSSASSNRLSGGSSYRAPSPDQLAASSRATTWSRCDRTVTGGLTLISPESDSSSTSSAASSSSSPSATGSSSFSLTTVSRRLRAPRWSISSSGSRRANHDEAT